MRKKFIVLISLIFTVLISGCGESMFSAGGNDQSPEARDMTVTKAFMDKDYDKILSLYSSDYSLFSNADAYNYVSALLGKGGFDILNGVDMFLGNSKNNTDDMYNMFYTLIGGKNNTNSQSIVNNAKQFFDNAAIVCNTVSCARLGGQVTLTQGVTSCSIKAADNSLNILDNNTAFVCSLAGGFGTVTNISNIVETMATIAGIDTSNMDTTTQAGIQDVVTQLQTKNQLDSSISSLTDNDLKDMANALNNLDGNISSLENIVGNISEVDTLFTGFASSNGEYTVESIRSGLSSYLTSIGDTANQ